MNNEKVYAKGFKAFNPGMKCLNKQYEENTIFTESGGNICDAGVMHFCEEPFSVLNYYPLLHENNGNICFNEFANVKALAPCQKSDEKLSTTKLKIGAKINIANLFKAEVNYIKEKSYSATTGNWAHSATTGEGAHSATTGYNAYSATTGDNAHSATTGNWAHSATTGDNAHSATTGNWAHSATTGDNAHSATTGEDAIAAALGINGAAKASLGSWLVLAEYNDKGNLICVKSTKVDGDTIKPNVFYILKNGEFTEE